MNAMLFDELSIELRPCSPVKSMQWESLCVDLRGSHAQTGSPRLCMQSANCILKPQVNPVAPSNFNRRNEDV